MTTVLRVVTAPCLAPPELLGTLDRFVEHLEAAEAHLNEINVFPIADGDTGTNMVRTARPLVAAARAGLADGASTGAADGPQAFVRRLGREALDAARGNSGLILAQYLFGFVVAVGHSDLASACADGATRARSAVAEPVDGTMLSVADAVALAAQQAVAADLDRGDVVAALVAQAHRAVALTPSQLPVLAAHGVVDAGAAGLALLFDALAATLSADAPVPVSVPVSLPVPVPVPVSVPEVSASSPVGAMSPEHSTLVELQFTAEMDDAGAQGMRALLADRGDDVVVSSASGTIRAHVHLDLDQLGGTIEAVLGVTRPSNITVEALPAPAPASGPGHKDAP